MDPHSGPSPSGALRRVKHLVGHVQDVGVIDLGQLFRGAVKETPARDISVLSLVSGRAHILTESQAALLLTIPSNRWVSSADVLAGLAGREEDLRELIRRELILMPGPECAEVESRENALSRSHWNGYAAVYHRMRRWRDVDVRHAIGPDQTAVADDDLGTKTNDPAPPHFYSPPAASGTRTLPNPVRDSSLYALLTARASRRAFDLERELAPEDLSTVLYYGFGCQGIIDGPQGARLLKKTSPSGGSLHPTEVYPLIRSVSGVPSGLYHYSVEHHALERLKEMSSDEAGAFALTATAGQTFARDAHVLLLLTARFDRQFWKYRRHNKAYGVLHMDVGHLSQTVYLVCTDLGLGACITGAINDASIDEELGLDGIRQGALAAIACGVPTSERGEEEPAFDPYLRSVRDGRIYQVRTR